MEVEREVEKKHKVPMDKVLKVEIHELLHTTDYGKVPTTSKIYTSPLIGAYAIPCVCIDYVSLSLPVGIISRDCFYTRYVDSKSHKKFKAFHF